MVFDIKKFRKDLITKRVLELEISLRQAAQQIGCSAATLNRIENSKLCDLETFCLICLWMKKNPQEYFNTSE